MIHHPTECNPRYNHYAAGYNDEGILIQVMDIGNQARIVLSYEEALHLISILKDSADDFKKYRIIN